MYNQLKTARYNYFFENNEKKVFDVKPYWEKGIFRKLKDESLFKTVRPFLGSIQWKNGQDLCPDTLYLDSTEFFQSKI
jgi:hypothetical protein